MTHNAFSVHPPERATPPLQTPCKPAAGLSEAALAQQARAAFAAVRGPSAQVREQLRAEARRALRRNARKRRNAGVLWALGAAALLMLLLKPSTSTPPSIPATPHPIPPHRTLADLLRLLSPEPDTDSLVASQPITAEPTPDQLAEWLLDFLGFAEPTSINGSTEPESAPQARATPAHNTPGWADRRHG